MMPTTPPQAPTPAPLHDITGPWALSDIPLEWMIGGALALIVLVLIGLAIWSARSRKPKLTPREVALRDLEALRGRPLTPYEFGVRASDVLRTFLHEAFGLDAMNRTSLEFLESLRDDPVFDMNQKAALAAFLEAADLMKFARVDAAREEIAQLMDTARRLVEIEPRREVVER
jgi:hypothetical protein